MMDNDTLFGSYIQELRQARGKSLRETAKAIGVSPQYYSEVEKNRRPALTADRLDALREWLNLNDTEAACMYNLAAESRKSKDTVVPQDFSDYIVERDYAMQALRVAKELGADERDWQAFVDALRQRRKE